MLIWGSRGLMVRESDSWARVSGPAGIVGGGNESTALSLLPQYPNEVSLSKALNPQLLPGSRSINGCPLLRVCVCFLLCVCVCTLNGLNAEHKFWVRVTILGHVTFTSLFSFCVSTGFKAATSIFTLVVLCVTIFICISYTCFGNFKYLSPHNYNVSCFVPCQSFIRIYSAIIAI